MSQQTIHTYPQLGPLADEWNRLARNSGSLFLTHEWLTSWWRAFGRGEPRWMVLHDSDGSLRAGACLRPVGRHRLASPTNTQSGHWDVVARDDAARSDFWAALIEREPKRLQLEAMHERAAGTRALCTRLERAGYRTVIVPGPYCPWVALPHSWEEMTGALSSKLRGEMRRRRRILERAGTLTFRSTTGGESLDEDLDKLFELEASGWKGREGTAILNDPATERLYRGFALAAAEAGWLRLNFLELDGKPIAADYGCVFGGNGVALRMGFSEEHRRAAPGVLLLAEMLRTAIAQEVSSYDLLGEASAFKTEWAPEVRPRVRIWAFRRGIPPAYVYRKSVRPMLKSARDRALGARERTLARGRDREGRAAPPVPAGAPSQAASSANGAAPVRRPGRVRPQGRDGGARTGAQSRR